MALNKVVFLWALVFLALGCFVVESTTSDDVVWGLSRNGGNGLSSSSSSNGLKGTCNGLVGDCIDEEDEMMMDSEINRRSLFRPKKYLSYGVLKKNNVPCGRRGASYYGCTKATKVNPYRRGCSAITRCKRFIN